MPTMTVGNSVTLTAQPMFNGMPGGVLPGPVTWSHMISPSSASVLFSQTGPTTTVQVQTVQNPCTLTMTATSGGLTASTTFDIVPQTANGMTIQVGPVM